MKILIGFGTRPEVIKLAPVIHGLSLHECFEVVTFSTGQHRELLRQALRSFDIVPTRTLSVTRSSASLSKLTAEVLIGTERVLAAERPDLLVIQGDTSSALSMALAAFHMKVPVAHVEAGVRSHETGNPFPEEMNRLCISRIATLHFAATEEAASNLLAERVPQTHVTVTGNTIVDALLLALTQESEGLTPQVKKLRSWSGRTILMTVHRRETWGEPLRRICRAMKAAIEERPELRIVFPVHPAPAVREAVEEIMSGTERVHLLDPQPYHAFVQLMRLSDLIVTDSGGIQEEAPSLGKPVLVVRDLTDRPESVRRGVADVVGTDENRIAGEVIRLISDDSAYQAMATKANLYGDGKAAGRIAAALADRFGLKLG